MCIYKHIYVHSDICIFFVIPTWQLCVYIYLYASTVCGCVKTTLFCCCFGTYTHSQVYNHIFISLLAFFVHFYLFLCIKLILANVAIFFFFGVFLCCNIFLDFFCLLCVLPLSQIFCVLFYICLYVCMCVIVSALV